MSLIQPVILSGGVGSRLWPMSRAMHPKQLQPLTSDDSLLQETARRVAAAEFAAPIIVCNDEHRFIIAAQLQEIGITPNPQVLEPFGRNTAPAVAAAALIAAEKDPETVLLVLPADHHIADLDAFKATILAGNEAAKAGKLVTFGIVPTAPETGYGYIKQGAPSGTETAFEVAAFKEKPNRAVAEDYLTAGGYYWNSGMFMFRADRFLEELERYAPDILAHVRDAVANGRTDLDFLRLEAQSFASCPADSIDYAVMEKTDAAVVIPADLGWSDVGAWNALWEIGTKDNEGNVLVGDVLTEDTRGCYVRSEESLVATLGVEDLVVIESGDVVMVAARDRVQDVRVIVDRLKKQGRTEHSVHGRVHRPWGYYESMQSGDRHLVKHLMVKPGGQLSLQLHNHRAEHWVVVAGTARVTIGDEVKVLGENEPAYIPVGVPHRLENPGDQPLSIIEVQTGAYLDEDDIVRLEDVYQRHVLTKTNIAE